jgi:hypothetical protein
MQEQSLCDAVRPALISTVGSAKPRRSGEISIRIAGALRSRPDVSTALRDAWITHSKQSGCTEPERLWVPVR